MKALEPAIMVFIFKIVSDEEKSSSTFIASLADQERVE